METLTKAELDSQLHKLGIPRPDDEQDMSPVLRDGIFQYVTELLRRFGQGDWALRPRTFCILHVLGCPQLMDTFVKNKATDAFLPYNDRNLPGDIKGADRSRFLKFQRIVLSNTDLGHLEREGGAHQHFHNKADDCFTHIKSLGEGSTGTVDHVYGPNTLKRFARKRIYRGTSALNDQKALTSFLNELSILKKASHRHLVKLVSSYTDPTCVGIIMRPVAEENLRVYLQRRLEQDTDRYTRKQCIRTFLGCLAKALEYLHLSNIQHRDVKPQNILVKQGEVYLADFGTSKAHGEASRSNSTGTVCGWTPKYAAPEILSYDPHGKPSDVWSLGCVFIEMATVILGRSLDDIDAFYTTHGTGHRAFHMNTLATAAWLSELDTIAAGDGMGSLAWIGNMTQYHPSQRPTISHVVAMMIDTQREHRLFCLRCLEIDHSHSTQQLTDFVADTTSQPPAPSTVLQEHSGDDAEDPVTERYLAKVSTYSAGTTRPVTRDIADITVDTESGSRDDTSSKGGVIVQFQNDGSSDSVASRSACTTPVLRLPNATPSAESNSGRSTPASLHRRVESRPILVSSSQDSSRDLQADRQISICNASGSAWQGSTKRSGRFSALHSDRRPLPMHTAPTEVNFDDQPVIAPEPLKLPPLDMDYCYPLPRASLVPSYILAGSNRFSSKEVKVLTRTVGSYNLFVYGRLMFPSTLRGFAAYSLKGAYSRLHQRRLIPSSQDWARADVSIQHAAEAMTPAVLNGFDAWRPTGYNLAVIQNRSFTPAILANRDLEQYEPLDPEPPGHVRGFLLMGLTEEALRYCDLVFSTEDEMLRRARATTTKDKPPSDAVGRKREAQRMAGLNPLLERREVSVDIQLTTGQNQSLWAETYVWKRGVADLVRPWGPEKFIRGSGLHKISDVKGRLWREEEATLANTMKLNYALVGDELCAAIVSGDSARLRQLLNIGTDVNAACRKHGTPLQAAVTKGYEDMVRLLLDFQANPSKAGGRYGTPLLAAVIGSRRSITELLLNKRANVFANDDQYVTALYQAAGHGDYTITEMLLEAGAWLGQDYEEVKDLASEKRNSDIQALLRKYDIRDAKLISIEASRARNHLGPAKGFKYLEGSSHLWEPVLGDSSHVLGSVLKNSSHVLKPVMLKFLSLLARSGPWTGLKGVAIVKTALAEGADPRILTYIREAMNPVQVLIDLLKGSMKPTGEVPDIEPSLTDRVQELDSDEEYSAVMEGSPYGDNSQNESSSDWNPFENPSADDWSSNSPRSPRSRSPASSVGPVERSPSPGSQSAGENRSMPGAFPEPSPQPEVIAAPTARISHSVPGYPRPSLPPSSAPTRNRPPIRSTHSAPNGRLDSRSKLPRFDPHFLAPPMSHRPRARSLEDPPPPYTAYDRNLSPASRRDDRIYEKCPAPMRQWHSDDRVRDPYQDRPPYDQRRHSSSVICYSRCTKCDGVGRYREIWYDRSNRRQTEEVHCMSCRGCGILIE